MLFKSSLCSNLASMTDSCIYVFFNGFGSDYHYWDCLLPYFESNNYVLLSENYFCCEEEYNFEELKSTFFGKNLIGVGHSQGYHKLCSLNQKYDFFNLKKIVAVQGFSRYLGTAEPMKSVRKFYLDFMKNSYLFNPEMTLYNFMAMCGSPMDHLPQNINQKQLMDDLELLYSGINPPEIPHLVLTSTDDWVIPFNIIEDNFRKLDDAKILYTSGAGHLLGMRFPEYVYKQVKEFAEN